MDYGKLNAEFVRCGAAEEHGRIWRVALYRADGTRHHLKFEDKPEATAEQQARAFVLIFREKQGKLGKSIGDVVNEYVTFLGLHGGSKRKPLSPQGQKTTRDKLVSLLQLAGPSASKRGRKRTVHGSDRPLSSLTPASAARLYRERTEQESLPGKLISAATHQGELIAANAMCEWAVTRGYLKANPFESVQTIGQVNKGKRTLRMDEARRWVRAAEADPHPVGGLAAWACLALGVRASELLQREARDLDDRGRVLVIDEQAEGSSVKTKKSERRVTLPPRLQARFMKLSAGLAPNERLFGKMTKGTLLDHVKRLCEVAGVPTVCTHGLRDTFGELTLEVEGQLAATSRHLGHSNTKVTREHYISYGVIQSSKASLLEAALFEVEQPIETELERLEREAREAMDRLQAMRAERGLKSSSVESELGTKGSGVSPGGLPVTQTPLN